ncbi:MAG: glycoside hydrolase family 16 protein [Pelagibacterales bacterium]|nr:glycoside hydrolase family 16 protein [Pelagibacterales bacterium]
MKRNYFLFALLVLLTVSCNKAKDSSDDNNSTINYNDNNSTTPVETYVFNNELVWGDEFDVDGSISLDKWNIETVAPNNGSWWNGELQYYTDKENNIKIEGGLLMITAKYESFNGKNYTSARINTQDKYEFTYGRVELRAKLPNWEGMWPAFWLLGANYDVIDWPYCGELDVLEHGDYIKESTVDDPGLISSAVHYGPLDHKSQYENIPNTFFMATGQENFVRAEKIIENPFDQFHTYAIQWAPDKIQFFIDDDMYFEFPLQAQHSPFDKPFFLILNLAVGGHWTDGYVAPGFDQATYEIDYVRIYQ